MGLGFAAFGAELPELEARCHEHLHYARPTVLDGPRTRRGRRLIIYYHGPASDCDAGLAPLPQSAGPGGDGREPPSSSKVLTETMRRDKTRDTAHPYCKLCLTESGGHGPRWLVRAFWSEKRGGCE